MHNRSPTSALSDSTAKTSYKLWYKSKPDISHLRVFACTTYVHVQKDQRRQLQSHSAKCVFIGYPTQYKGWLFWNPSTCKEIISDSAVFDERSFPGTSRTPVQLTVHAPDTSDLPEQGGVEIEADVLPAPPPPPAPAQPADPPAPSTMPTPDPTPSPPPSPPHSVGNIILTLYGLFDIHGHFLLFS